MPHALLRRSTEDTSTVPALSEGVPLEVPAFRRSRQYPYALGSLILWAVFAGLGIWLDVVISNEQQYPGALGGWVVLTIGVLTCIGAVILDRNSRAPHAAELTSGMWSAGGAFFLALFASNNGWPSVGVGVALGGATLCFGTCAVLIRSRLRDVAEIEHASTATTLRSLQQQVEDVHVALRGLDPAALTIPTPAPALTVANELTLGVSSRIAVAIRVIAKRTPVMTRAGVAEAGASAASATPARRRAR